jgi:hypothetical protein
MCVLHYMSIRIIYIMYHPASPIYTVTIIVYLHYMSFLIVPDL